MRGNGVGLERERGRIGGKWDRTVGEKGRSRGVKLGGVGWRYKRKGQLIWPHSLPLTAPRPLASN